MKAQIPVPGDLPAKAMTVLTDLNTTISGITTKASTALAKEHATLADVLTKEAEAHQQKGALDAMVACQRQLATPDRPQEGLPKSVLPAVEAYVPLMVPTRLLGNDCHKLDGSDIWSALIRQTSPSPTGEFLFSSGSATG
jgi:hypothetical protein